MGIVAGIPEGGVDPLAAIKDLLSNPEAYKRKLDDLESAQKAADERIALAGKAGEILQLRAEADKDRGAAADVLADAKAKADAMLSQASEVLSKAKSDAAAIASAAQADAASMLVATRAECEAMRKQSADELADAKSKSSEVKKAIAAANKREVEAQAAKYAATKAEFAANNLRDEFEKKLAKIKAAVGD